jgi:hypothetical protein
MYTPFISSIISKYGAVKQVIETDVYTRGFINSKLQIKDILAFVEMEDDELRRRLSVYIADIVSEKIWNDLVKNNLITYQQISLNDSSDYSEMNVYYIEQAFPKLSQYKKIMSGVNINYQKQKLEFDRKCADMLDRINQLEIEYGNVGFLSFKKKKFINQQLEEQKVAYYEYAKHNEPHCDWI